MGLLFYVKYMQTANVTSEKPLCATRGENATATGRIANGLAVCAGDIAMQGSARLTGDTASIRGSRHTIFRHCEWRNIFVRKIF